MTGKRLLGSCVAAAWPALPAAAGVPLIRKSSQERQWVMMGQLLTEVPCLNALVTAFSPPHSRTGVHMTSSHARGLSHLIKMVGPSLAATRGPPPLEPSGLASQLASRTSRGDRGRTLSLD